MRARVLAAATVLVLQGVFPAVAAETVFTLDDVSKHAVESDCWSVVRGRVYNLTAWIAQHPHGSADILSMCGRDATGDYETEHIGTEAARMELARFQLGYLPDAAPTPSPTPQPTVTSTTKPAANFLVCVNGKQTKKVSAARCPRGWKLKR